MSDNSVKFGRKQHAIRTHFIMKNNRLCCQILGCTYICSLTATTSQLKKHILNSHPNLVVDNTNDSTESENNTIVMDDEHATVYSAFAKVFAKYSLPHSLITRKPFLHALEVYKNSENITLSKVKLRDEILSLSKKNMDDILHHMVKSEDPVTLAIDGWTNVRSNKVINLLLISNGVAYYYCSVENWDNLNNAEWLVSQLKEQINNLLLLGIRLTSVTSDNDNVMKTTCKILNQLFPVLIHVPCSAHILQLCLKKICEIPKVKDIIDDVLAIVNFIKSSTEETTILNNLQIAANVKPLKLKRPSKTRWSSLIKSISVLLKLKLYVSVIITNLDNIFWANIEELYLLLQPFEEYTDQIQTDQATLYSVYLNIEKIKIKFMPDKLPLIFSDIAADLKFTFEQKWNDHININLINTAKFFNFDITFNINNTTIEYITNWGSIYLTTYRIGNEQNIEEVKKILDFQIIEMITKQAEFKMLDSTIDNLKKYCVKNGKVYSPILTWGRYQTSHYELSKVAIAIHSICPTEACVERSFSAQTDVHSKKRNRLIGNVIEAEMRLKFNS